jgi:uncharacterized membrane protein YfcA
MAFWQQQLIVCSLVFFAGLVDAVAGGGGIISLPAYLAVGLPFSVARGCNKFSSVIGLTLTSARFIKRRKVNYHAAASAGIAALIGSSAGAWLSIALDNYDTRYFQYIMIASLPVLAFFILKNKGSGEELERKDLPLPRLILLSGAAGLLIGCYDGFYGPGAGTFLIIVFNTVIGLDVLTASGTAKLVNFASNLAAVITFFRDGDIMFSLAVPAAAFSLLGALVGTRLAFKNGAKLIRPAFVVVLGLLLIKIVYDLLTQI